MTVEQSSTSTQEQVDLSQIIRINEAKVSKHLNGLVRETVQETLNKMLDAEAQEMCNAQRYERTEARKDCRAGFYQRKLQTQAGEVELNVPKLRYAQFETAIIKRYRRLDMLVQLFAGLIHRHQRLLILQQPRIGVQHLLHLRDEPGRIPLGDAESLRPPRLQDVFLSVLRIVS